MIAAILEKVILFPFELLNEFLTAFFFPTSSSQGERRGTQTVREQTLSSTVKRLQGKLLVQKAAHDRAVEYLQGLLREQAGQHRKEREELERRHRDHK